MLSLHKEYANALNRIINNQEDIPSCFSQGITYLLPKTEETQQPNKFRPITCLPTIYKRTTRIITTEVSNHLETNNILSDEQTSGKRNTNTKEQLILKLQK